ncbi:MAG TPA: hypothetical protein VJT73_19840 [Polyangiaceae bacterium]|nr:hypothetical protein [Polyangiaceae bacterium]
MAQWLQSRREQQRIAGERKTSNLSRLRAAYAELFATVTKIDAELRDIAAPYATGPFAGGGNPANWGSDAHALAARAVAAFHPIGLLEDDEDARGRVQKFLERYDALGQLAEGSPSEFWAWISSLEWANDERDLASWLRDVRFKKIEGGA